MTYILVQVKHMKQEKLKNTGKKKLKAEQSFSKLFSFVLVKFHNTSKRVKRSRVVGGWQSQICWGHLTTKDLGVRGAAAATTDKPVGQSHRATAGSAGVLQSKKELLFS